MGSATDRSSQESTASQRKKKMASMAVPMMSLGEVRALQAASMMPRRFMAEMSPISFIPLASRMSPTVPAVTAMNMMITVLNMLFSVSPVIDQFNRQSSQFLSDPRAGDGGQFVFMAVIRHAAGNLAIRQDAGVKVYLRHPFA